MSNIYLRFEEVKEALAKNKEQALDELLKDNSYRLIEDTIAEMEW